MRVSIVSFSRCKSLIFPNSTQKEPRGSLDRKVSVENSVPKYFRDRREFFYFEILQRLPRVFMFRDTSQKKFCSKILAEIFQFRDILLLRLNIRTQDKVPSRYLSVSRYFCWCVFGSEVFFNAASQTELCPDARALSKSRTLSGNWVSLNKLIFKSIWDRD